MTRLGLGLCFLWCFGFLESAAAAERPNIILLMGDDHGWEETGYHGHPHVKTPVLDEMAASGLRLERFHAAHPNCSPTRASVLTGRHPNRIGTFAPGFSIRPEEITLAQILRRAGYRCGHFGKWHVGPVKQDSPTSPGAMGFHEWTSHDNFFELNPPLSKNGGPPQVYPGESSAVVIQQAIEFIRHSHERQQPSFVVVWFGSPHEPYSGLPEDLALYDGLVSQYPKTVRLTSNATGQPVTRPQGEVLRERYTEITAMDRSIGTLRTYLAQTRQRDNTLLFYCGDNGTSPESALGVPHRGAKGQVYEGGTLVPGLLEWPAKIPVPRVSLVQSCTSDLLPTVCELLEVPLPARPLDGISLVPALKGSPFERPSPLCFWEYTPSPGNRDRATPWIDLERQQGTTPLVKLMAGKATRDFLNYRFPADTPLDSTGPRAIIDGSLKLVLHELPNGSVREELFDLSSDPAERHNRIAENPDAARQLKQRLQEWQQNVWQSLLGADYGMR